MQSIRKIVRQIEKLSNLKRIARQILKANPNLNVNSLTDLIKDESIRQGIDYEDCLVALVASEIYKEQTGKDYFAAIAFMS
jgi:uncharacterized protein YutE (UPF0331/DUF86 family)